MRDILLATVNPAKQARLSWLLKGLPVTCRAPDEVGLAGLAGPEEGESTHIQIAREKAVAWCVDGSMMAISSDGGLEIPALGERWQSVLTHRLSGDGTDQERVARLLEMMRSCSGGERQATWLEALAIADKGTLIASWEVRGATGYVAEAPGPLSAVPGFWAFSVWQIPALGKRYSELTDAELAQVEDHWTQLKDLVQSFLGESAVL